MMWEKVKLGDIALNIQTGPFGSQLHQSDYSDVGTTVVMPQDIVGYSITTHKIARVGENHVNRLSRYKLNQGDILFPRRGDVGKCAYITENEEGWLCGTGCLKVEINPNVADSKFIAYQLRLPNLIEWLEKSSVGATMPNINRDILAGVPLELPDLPTQKKVVGTLSNYDALIEVNEKRIKILEEMAMRIYREWFVQMRFPGHQSTQLKKGLPEGWHFGILLNLGEFRRGKNITKDETILGNIPVVSGGINPACYHNKANAKGPVVTVSASGANAGFTRLYYEDIWAANCSYIDSSCQNIMYLYVFLKVFKTLIENLQKGAAQPHVYAKDLNNLSIVIPSEKLIKDYQKRVTPIFQVIHSLNLQNKVLQKMRDRLLPRLMNGKITL